MSYVKIAFILILVVALMIGCFPERHPTNPLQYETRRPLISYFAPTTGAFVVEDGDSLLPEPKTPAGEAVSKADAIQIWFDELMDQTTIPPAFQLSLAVEEQPWTHIQSVAALAQSRSYPDFIMAALGNKGAFSSSDGGASWNFVRTLAQQTVTLLRMDPENAAIIYAATSSGLQKSSNSGSDWQLITTGLPDNCSITCLDFNPSNTGQIWLGTDRGIFRSDNGGASWSAVGALPNWREDKPVGRIIVDPQNASTIYCATLGRYIYKSIDQGASWEMKRNGLPTSQIYDLAIDADTGSMLYAATINRGVYKSADNGENWVEKNTGLDDLNARKLRLDPGNSGRIIVATTDRIFISEDGAESWRPVSTPASLTGIVELLLHPDDDGSILLASPNMIYQTRNSGIGWQEINAINSESITVGGTFSYTTYQDTLIFIEAGGDTVIFSPYRYDDVLATYDAGLVAEPPEGIDPDPKATQVTFRLDADLFFSGWMYRLRITGAFKGSDWRGDVAPKDVHGMSLEYDYIAYIKTQ